MNIVRFAIVISVVCMLACPLFVPQAPAEPARATEKPDHNGPYTAAWCFESFKGSSKAYYNTLKIFYPAASGTENATANLTGAPFPTIVMLPFMTGNVEVYNSNAPVMVSWGMVVVVFGVNWNDASNSANPTDLNELLNQLETENQTGGHKLQGMMDKSGYGISGISAGGAKSVIAGRYVSRIAAVEANGPALLQSDTDLLATGWNRPLQVQVGTADTDYRPYGVYIYNKMPGTKMLLDIVNGGHVAPYMWDDIISFFFRYLRNDTGYDEYLYRFGTMDDIANGTYYLNYSIPGVDFFPGNLTQEPPNPAAVSEDGTSVLSATTTGYWPIGHARGAFKWDLDSDGNADISDPQNLTVNAVFAKSGSKTIRLYYQLGSCRINAKNTVFVTVSNQLPVINLTESSFACEEGGRLNFSVDINDTPSDRAGLLVMWEFGDGGTSPYSALTTVGHTFTKSGNLTLKATVKDTDGATATATAAVRVSNLPPSVTASVDTQIQDEGVDMTFSGIGSDTLGDIATLQYRWDFGDGNSTEWRNGADATHAYVRSGNYTATLKVKDDDGSEAAATLKVSIINQPPGAAIVKPGAGKTFPKDEPVEFDGSGTDTAGDLSSLRYSWDFGDGKESNWSADAKAEHTYTKGGKYKAMLRVSDDDGARGEATVNLTVENQAPTLTIQSPKTSDFNEDQKVQFTASGDDTESDLPKLNFTWEIDGRTYYGSAVEVTFATAGPKTFRLTVSDPEGANATASGELNIKNLPPKLSASIDTLSVLVNQTINFTATGTDTASDMPLLKVKWDFGDGTSSSDFNGSHIYSKAGTYTLTATLTDDQGQKVTQTLTVSVTAPVTPMPPKKPDPPQDTGMGMTPVYIGVGVAIAAVAGIVALMMMRKPKRPAPDAAPQPSVPPAAPEAPAQPPAAGYAPPPESTPAPYPPQAPEQPAMPQETPGQ